jgi:putative membrane protein
MAMMWGIGWAGMWAGWVFMALILAALAAGIVWLVRGVNRPGDDGRDSARRILDERFASGEITPEEYENRRRALR